MLPVRQNLRVEGVADASLEGGMRQVAPKRVSLLWQTVQAAQQLSASHAHPAQSDDSLLRPRENGRPRHRPDSTPSAASAASAAARATTTTAAGSTAAAATATGGPITSAQRQVSVRVGVAEWGGERQVVLC